MRTLVDTFEQSCKRFKTRVAIDSLEGRLTYAELEEVTRHLASRIRRRCKIEDLKVAPIAILIPRSIEFYVAQIAVLRAGGFFLPIDPSQPLERIEFVLADSQSTLLLVPDNDSCLTPESPSASSMAIPVMAVSQAVNVERSAEAHDGDADDGAVAFEVATADDGEVGENDFAYMIYTSGSSGQPKGVAIAHRAIWNLCHWWETELGLAHGERTLQMISVGFDACLEEIFPTLLTGGTLVPIHPRALDSMEQFLNFVDQQKVNYLHLPAAFWHALSASFETHKALRLPASVTTVVVGGEKIDSTQVESWFSRIGSEVRLINAYGPTEAAVAASYAILRPGKKPSIGKPIGGVRFRVVDEDGNLVETGQAGELYIGGEGIASGYWRRPRLSAEKFVDNPFNDDQVYYRTGDQVRLNGDGEYEFIGRIDDQIKLRGYRIEPGEISNCLSTQPQVSQAHVIAQQVPQASNTRQLVGYVIPKPGIEPEESELRAFLSERLPSYMVPTRIVLLDSFPVTPGGKLDWKRFPNPSASQIPLANDGELLLLTPTERKVSKIWGQILGIGRLDRDANFFQMGGDSLLAMRLVLLLESEFPGPVLPVAALIPNPTIASLANYLDRRQHDSTPTGSREWPVLTRFGAPDDLIRVVCIHAAGGGAMFYRSLLEGLAPEQATAVLESAILYQDGPAISKHQSIAGMAEDYVDCLIDAGCGKELTLVGYSFGGLLAFEMSRLLKERGYATKKIINIDSPNPQSMIQRNRISTLFHRFWSPGTSSERKAQFKEAARLKRRTAELNKWTEARQPPPAELRPLALELVFGAIAESYAPEPMDVWMHLICGHSADAYYHIPEDYGWTEKVTTLTSVQIPGGHNSIFSQPYLPALVAAFHSAVAGGASVESSRTK